MIMTFNIKRTVVRRSCTRSRRTTTDQRGQVAGCIARSINWLQPRIVSTHLSLGDILQTLVHVADERTKIAPVGHGELALERLAYESHVPRADDAGSNSSHFFEYHAVSWDTSVDAIRDPNRYLFTCINSPIECLAVDLAGRHAVLIGVGEFA
jgi:hypothetical protein